MSNILTPSRIRSALAWYQLDADLDDETEHDEMRRYNAATALAALDAVRWRDPAEEPPEEEQACITVLVGINRRRLSMKAFYRKGRFYFSGSDYPLKVIKWMPWPKWEDEE